MRLYYRVLGVILYASVAWIPAIVFADTAVCASGFSTQNGTYYLNGTFNGKPVYEGGTEEICFADPEDRWQFNPIADSCTSGPNVHYYDNPPTDLPEPFDVATWTVGSGGSPAGSVVDCSTSTPPATTTIATSTADTNALAYGVAWVLFFMSLIFTGFIWNKV